MPRVREKDYRQNYQGCLPAGPAGLHVRTLQGGTDMVTISIMNRTEISGEIEIAPGEVRLWNVFDGKIIIDWLDRDSDEIQDNQEPYLAEIRDAVLEEEDHNPR